MLGSTSSNLKQKKNNIYIVTLTRFEINKNNSNSYNGYFNLHVYRNCNYACMTKVA